MKGLRSNCCIFWDLGYARDGDDAFDSPAALCAIIRNRQLLPDEMESFDQTLNAESYEIDMTRQVHKAFERIITGK